MRDLLGILTISSDAAELVLVVERALPCIRHRGPDSVDTWHDEDTTFGFNRLSIIDIAHGHQPLQQGPENRPSRYSMTFNGEIYSFVELRKQLEKEGYAPNTSGNGKPIVVGLHHRGADVVKHLRGMFGITIQDSVERELSLARDPFGIKSLYYATTERGTIFGSERRSLLEAAPEMDIDAKRLNKRALEHYVDLQCVPESESLHTNIVRLELGCVAIVTLGDEVEQTCYFKLNFSTQPVTKDVEQDVFSRVTHTLRDSVEKHMRADVTAGSFLPGGIDSTATAALAERRDPNLPTSTTSFERKGFSEVDVVAESTAVIGVEHTVKIVSLEEFAGAIPKITWHLDDSVVDPAPMLLYFVMAEARKHVKVVLSGEDADELFGGYTTYKEPLSPKPFNKAPSPLLHGLAKIGEALPEGICDKPLLQRGTTPLKQRYYGSTRSFSSGQLQEVLPWAKKERDRNDVTTPIHAQLESWGLVTRMRHLDLSTRLCGDILVEADKIAMANSLGLRVPFLNRIISDVVQTLLVDMHVSHDTTRYALRRAMKRIVPRYALSHRKLDFPVPTRHWLTGDKPHGWAEDIIREFQTEGFINKDAVLKMLAEHHPTERDHSHRPQTILAFMTWYGIFIRDRTIPDIKQHDYLAKL